ncbi:hypothetical protein ACLKA6_009802 [Drosophila palustris]
MTTSTSASLPPCNVTISSNKTNSWPPTHGRGNNLEGNNRLEQLLTNTAMAMDSITQTMTGSNALTSSFTTKKKDAAADKENLW